MGQWRLTWTVPGRPAKASQPVAPLRWQRRPSHLVLQPGTCGDLPQQVPEGTPHPLLILIVRQWQRFGSSATSALPPSAADFNKRGTAAERRADLHCCVLRRLRHAQGGSDLAGEHALVRAEGEGSSDALAQRGHSGRFDCTPGLGLDSCGVSGQQLEPERARDTQDTLGRAPLRYRIAGRVESALDPRDQIARASSVNAAATRVVGRGSTASS